jgi:glutathione S-transferase
MAYTLITANRNYSSWSLRPWVLMTVLGIPFENRLEPFAQSVNYDAFRSFSPTGQVPVLIDGDRIIWDSFGILLYLADRHRSVWPCCEDAKAWSQSAVAEMHAGFTALRNDCPMNVGVRVETHEPSAALKKDIARLVELWTQGLTQFKGSYLAGPEFSAADAFFAPVAFRVRTYGLDVGSTAQAWVDRMLALPAMREWERQGLAETWREPSHEQEMGAAGRIVADYRAGAA